MGRTRTSETDINKPPFLIRKQYIKSGGIVKQNPAPEPFSLKEWLSVFHSKTFCLFLGFSIFIQVAVNLLLAIFIFYIDIVARQYKNYEGGTEKLKVGQPMAAPPGEEIAGFELLTGKNAGELDSSKKIICPLTRVKIK